jgi:DNA (cytosine-5)-methyltransferase 1
MQTKESFYLTEPLLPDGYERFYDTFAGGGGSGSGILKAYGRLGIQPNGTFVNHWDKAIEIHSANHPEHRHFKEDLFLMNPVEHMPKQRYGLGWSSPSCQQFSISRGNRPINEQGRSHADTVVEWMIHCLPEVQFVENVKEFLQWGRLRQRRCKKTEELLWAMEVPGKKKGTTKIRTFPTLDPEHRRRKNEPEAEWELRMIGLGYDRHMEPDPEFKGEYFLAWVKRIEALGYVSDYRLLRSADYGDPTIRQRLFVQFVRIDTGKRIVWPDQRFIKPGAKRPVFNKHQDRPLLPWPTARNSVIDWSHKGTSIFSGRKPLAKATMRRIAIGLVKFGLRDFFVPQSNFGGDRTRSTDEPVSTIQCNHRGEMLVDAFSLTSNKGFDAGIRGLDKPSGRGYRGAVDHPELWRTSWADSQDRVGRPAYGDRYVARGRRLVRGVVLVDPEQAGAQPPHESAAQPRRAAQRGHHRRTYPPVRGAAGHAAVRPRQRETRRL